MEKDRAGRRASAPASRPSSTASATRPARRGRRRAGSRCWRRWSRSPAVVEEPRRRSRFPAGRGPGAAAGHARPGARPATAGQPVLDRLDLRLDPDDRIALLGANGNGKSTFAKLLAGRLAAAGRRRSRARAACGSAIFAQHQIEELEPEQSALAARAGRGCRRRPRQQIRARLGPLRPRRRAARRRGPGTSRAARRRGCASPDAPGRAAVPDPGRADQPPRRRLPRGADRGAQRVPGRRPADQPRPPPDRARRRPALARGWRAGPALRGRPRRLPPPPARDRRAPPPPRRPRSRGRTASPPPRAAR